jgi:hypothetical protein
VARTPGDRVEGGLRPATLPYHRTCGFPHPAVKTQAPYVAIRSEGKRRAGRRNAVLLSAWCIPAGGHPRSFTRCVLTDVGLRCSEPACRPHPFTAGSCSYGRGFAFRFSFRLRADRLLSSDQRCRIALDRICLSSACTRSATARADFERLRARGVLVPSKRRASSRVTNARRACK